MVDLPDRESGLLVSSPVRHRSALVRLALLFPRPALTCCLLFYFPVQRVFGTYPTHTYQPGCRLRFYFPRSAWIRYTHMSIRLTHVYPTHTYRPGCGLLFYTRLRQDPIVLVFGAINLTVLFLSSAIMHVGYCELLSGGCGILGASSIRLTSLFPFSAMTGIRDWRYKGGLFRR